MGQLALKMPETCPAMEADHLQVTTAPPVLVLVLPASVHAIWSGLERQTWSAGVRQHLEHRPFCAETSESQHPKSPAQACTVTRRSAQPFNACSFTVTEIVKVPCCARAGPLSALSKATEWLQQVRETQALHSHCFCLAVAILECMSACWHPS